MGRTRGRSWAVSGIQIICCPLQSAAASELEVLGLELMAEVARKTSDFRSGLGRGLDLESNESLNSSVDSLGGDNSGGGANSVRASVKHGCMRCCVLKVTVTGSARTSVTQGGRGGGNIIKKKLYGPKGSDLT